MQVEFGDVEISAPKQLVADYAGDAEAYASDIVSTYEADTTVQNSDLPIELLLLLARAITIPMFSQVCRRAESVG